MLTISPNGSRHNLFQRLQITGKFSARSQHWGFKRHGKIKRKTHKNNHQQKEEEEEEEEEMVRLVCLFIYTTTCMDFCMSGSLLNVSCKI